MKPFLSRDNWLSRQLRRLAYKTFGVRSGPSIIAVRGEWLYIGPEGMVWRLRPTYDPHMPLTLTLEHY